MYISCKEALALERSKVDSLNKALAEEQREHVLTKKANIALNDKYCVLVEKHNKLEKQYNLLCESTHIPPTQMTLLFPPLAKDVENTIILT